VDSFASFNFDLTPVETIVRLNDKEYVLREASGGAAAAWRNAMLKATKLGPDGKPTQIDGLPEADYLLLSMCLFRKTDTDVGEVPVSLLDVKRLPNRVSRPLIAWVKANSELEEADEDETEEALLRRRDEIDAKLARLRGDVLGKG
jgi:hypothetical protein